ncbi:probable G-protein coupled receptor 21 [Diadema antillarum]|uniref:probable G-protein coupled receptor 21 n=1 Tax=Diadema antillarum TaxID=105358 RepID=UPI003A870342
MADMEMQSASTSDGNFSYIFFDYSDSFANSTDIKMMHQPNIALAIVFGLTTLSIVVSNIMTLTVLHRVPTCFEEVPRIIFQTLAVTDLLTGLLCSMLSCLFSVAPHLQNALTCSVRTMACTTCINLSALVMAFATVDRYIAVTKPLRYPSLMTTKRTKIVIAVLASIAAGNGLLTNIGADYSSNVCVSDFTAVGIGISFRPALLLILLIHYSSILVAAIANFKVIRIALRHSNTIAEQYLAARAFREPANKSEAADPLPFSDENKTVIKRGIWTVIMATVMFYIAVLPWNIMTSLHFAKHVKIPPPLRMAAALLIISNSWWNVIIYSLMNRTFRRAGRNMLKRCCRSRTNFDTGTDSEMDHYAVEHRDGESL